MNAPKPLDRPVLFPWVPKAAGTSIWFALEMRRDVTVQRLIHVDRFRAGVDVATFQHRGLEWLVDRGAITAEWLAGAFVLGWVRNPWARLVSIYTHLVQHEHSPYRELAAAHGPDFRAFADWATSGDAPPVGPSMLWGADYANRQLDWFRYRGALRCDFWGRVESINEDWPRACEAMGIPRPRRLDRWNASSHKPYRDYYDAALRNRAGRYYAAEIERFEYGF